MFSIERIIETAYLATWAGRDFNRYFHCLVGIF